MLCHIKHVNYFKVGALLHAVINSNYITEERLINCPCILPPWIDKRFRLRGRPLMTWEGRKWGIKFEGPPLGKKWISKALLRGKKFKKAFAGKKLFFFSNFSSRPSPRSLLVGPLQPRALHLRPFNIKVRGAFWSKFYQLTVFWKDSIKTDIPMRCVFQCTSICKSVVVHI